MSRAACLSCILAAAGFAVLFSSIPGFAADASCQLIFDSATKLFAVPTHSYTTATLADGKTRTTEVIYANGAIYVLLNVKWIRGKMTPQDMLQQEQENIRNAKTTCRHVRDESVNNEAAALYTPESENQGVKSSAQTWISKSKGMPLRTETSIQGKGQSSTCRSAMTTTMFAPRRERSEP